MLFKVRVFEVPPGRGGADERAPFTVEAPFGHDEGMRLAKEHLVADGWKVRAIAFAASGGIIAYVLRA